MTEPHALTEEEEIEFEIDMIDNEIQILQSRREFLCHQKTLLLQHRIECQQQPISLDDDNEEEEKKERETEENEEDEILSAKMQNILSEIFHFPALRPGQYDLIKYSYLNYDIFGVMKTSGGKSLCYQLLAFLFDHNCFILVVSPLIALIYDQVNYMNKILPGSAIALAGTMDRSQSSDIYRQMDQIGSISSQTGAKRSSNPLKLIFVTPEKIINSKLLMSHLQKAFDRNALARIVIDEAHCASQWGHDFRTDYSKLHILRTVFPTVPMMLLTATANLTVRKDVIQMMRLGTPSSRPRKQSLEGFNSSLLSIQGLKVFVSDFDRPNLQFDVLRKPSEFSECLDLIIAVIMETIPHFNSQTREAPNMKSRSGHVIIYCFSQKDCEKVAVGLSERGYSASPYHAGLDDRLRQQIQENWMNGSRPHQIICATIAFGLGINVPTVRLVLHFTISKSLELYYQEVSFYSLSNSLDFL
jgi:ATP-dependent DNA helicase Q1